MELELSNEINSLLSDVGVDAEGIDIIIQGFNESKLEQVDEKYFESFTRDLASHVANVVSHASQFRILPMQQLEVLQNICTSLTSLFDDVCEKVYLKIGLVPRNDLQTENVLLGRFYRSLSIPAKQLSNLDMEISRHIISLGNGSFFMPLENVWYPFNTLVSLSRSCLPRKRPVENTGISNLYERTATQAVQNNVICAIDCDRSQTSSANYVNMFDIFGNRYGRFPFAHLMPHSKYCASLWFAIVPWVLLLAENVTLDYDLAKKCIHGVIVKDGTSISTGKELPQSAPVVAAAPTDRTKREKAPRRATATIKTQQMSDGLPLRTGKNMKIAVVAPTRKQARDDTPNNDRSNTINDTKRQKLTRSAKIPPGKKQSDRRTTTSQMLTRSMPNFNAENKESGGDNKCQGEGNVCKNPAITKTLVRASTTAGSRQCDATKLHNVGLKHCKRRVTDSKNSPVALVGNDGEQSGTTTTASSTCPRVRNVGIKHFRSNRIKLFGHAEFFDVYPCLLIVPILTPAEVASWSGGGYSAIVLAGAGIEVEAERICAAASLVYRTVRACEGSTPGDFLATYDDLEKATALLQHTVRALADSCKMMYSNELNNTTTQLNDDITNKPKTVMAYDKILKQTPKIPVPAIRRNVILGSATLSIRKISFRDVNNTSRYHFAPDPALLVTKAASNWLKRQHVDLLPGWNLHDDNDTDSGISDDNDIISFSKEADLRGWSINYKKIPEEITLSEFTDIEEEDNDFLSVCDED